MSSRFLIQPLAAWDTQTLAQASAGGLAVVALYFVLLRRRSSLLFPPGPSPKPLIGNLLDLPPADDVPWYKWSQWADAYGEDLPSASPYFPLMMRFCISQAMLFTWKCSDST